MSALHTKGTHDISVVGLHHWPHSFHQRGARQRVPSNDIHVTLESLGEKVISLVPDTVSYTSSIHCSFETGFSIFICLFTVQVIDDTDVPECTLLLTLLQKIEQQFPPKNPRPRKNLSPRKNPNESVNTLKLTAWAALPRPSKTHHHTQHKVPRSREANYPED